MSVSPHPALRADLPGERGGDEIEKGRPQWAALAAPGRARYGTDTAIAHVPVVVEVAP
jgi:hypothetical protein